MKLKALKEKRHNLLNELEAMVSDIEGAEEVRTLSVEERAAFDDMKKQIEDIDATIKIVEETRAKEVGKEAELVEERKAEAVEVRALEKFLRGQDLVGEERAMLASANSAIMPQEISKTILKKLEEVCPVLEQAKRFSSKGTLRLIREDNYGNAQITAENAGFHNGEVTFDTVELRAFKVSAQVSATFELLQNAEIDLTQYLLDVIVRRLGKELNKLFITGDGSNKPQGLLKAENTYEFAGAAVTIEDYIMMQTAINPAYLDKACWIMNRDMFQKTAKLLDNMGRPYLTSDVINGKIQYTLLGVPVIVDMHVEESKVILANIGEAYSINMLTDITVRHLVETGFTSGVEVYAGYVMADGRIVNEDAILVGTVQPGRSKTATK